MVYIKVAYHDIIYHLIAFVSRGVMPIQSKGARASSDFWAKWILNAASKRQKIAD